MTDGNGTVILMSGLHLVEIMTLFVLLFSPSSKLGLLTSAPGSLSRNVVMIY